MKELSKADIYGLSLLFSGSIVLLAAATTDKGGDATALYNGSGILWLGAVIMSGLENLKFLSWLPASALLSCIMAATLATIGLS